METVLEASTLDTVMELINEQGFDGMSRAISVLINEAMKVERARVLNALPYERTKERKGYADGFVCSVVRKFKFEVHFLLVLA